GRAAWRAGRGAPGRRGRPRRRASGSGLRARRCGVGVRVGGRCYHAAVTPAPANPVPAALAIEEPQLTIRERYKRAFLKGLATLLPTVLTAYVLLATYDFIASHIARPL